LLQNVDIDSATDQRCCVVLPDGSDVWLQVSAGHMVGTLLDKLSNRLQHPLECIDIVLADTNKVFHMVV